MSMFRWQTALVAGALVLAGGRSAHAQAQPVDPEKRAAAQALFDAGRKLTAQDKFAEACPKLLESYRLDPAIGTKFYLADCYEHVGRLASAWTYYLEVVEDAQKEGAKDREKFATTRADALKPRLPQLVVKRSAAARAVPGLVVERDGLRVGEGMYDTPVPVDLGQHTVRVSAPGKKAIELKVEAKQEGVEVVVEIPALAADAPPPLDPNQTVTPPIEPRADRARLPTRRIAGFAVGGAGVVSLGVGIGLGALAISKKSASNAPGVCNAADVCTRAVSSSATPGSRRPTPPRPSSSSAAPRWARASCCSSPLRRATEARCSARARALRGPRRGHAARTVLTRSRGSPVATGRSRSRLALTRHADPEVAQRDARPARLPGKAAWCPSC